MYEILNYSGEIVLFVTDFNVLHLVNTSSIGSLPLFIFTRTSRVLQNNVNSAHQKNNLFLILQQYIAVNKKNFVTHFSYNLMVVFHCIFNFGSQNTMQEEKNERQENFTRSNTRHSSSTCLKIVYYKVIEVMSKVMTTYNVRGKRPL